MHASTDLIGRHAHSVLSSGDAAPITFRWHIRRYGVIQSCSVSWKRSGVRYSAPLPSNQRDHHVEITTRAVGKLLAGVSDIDGDKAQA